tara:strand:+ start:233 stop:511 length:279 start_codon:yes stop_codon:yes gene_type:complete
MFQKIVNGIAIGSGIVSLTVVGSGLYLAINKDAIIEDIKGKVIESVMPGIPGVGGFGGALTGGSDPIPGSFAGENAAAGGASMGLPIPGSPF